MNIFYKNQTRTYFEELKVGDVFQIADFEVYMKVEESKECKNSGFTFNAINLQDGTWAYFVSMVDVKKLDVELVIK